ncbi:uncharacterized protein LOC119392741 isoform X2 [Rhipicephalus sanguineus]|uniref:uncharacterized protein LOC119392741 isoform X2 n=1 Tax=Rhipicephalus sanguineus TaxID=34632 RepID=UPI0020C39479|nr:uncharacterized protein LOC119392741 isoform X2 [Rhipicephalus sanguineus]
MSSHRAVCVGSRVSDRQKELLLAFVREHPQIATLSCPLKPSFTREDRDDMWQELVALLNEVPARNTTALPNSESSRDGSPRSEPASMCTIWGLPSPAPPRFLVGNNFRGLQVSPAPAAAGVAEEDVAQDLPRATTPHAAAARWGQPAGPGIIGKLRQVQLLGDAVHKLQGVGTLAWALTAAEATCTVICKD